MADCVACGARLDDGITRCPQCGATLSRPGGLAQIGGWVLFFMSSIPIVVGVIAAEQANYVPLALGIGVCLLGIITIVIGRIKTAGSPETTRPSPAPLGPQAPPAPGGAPGR